MAEKLEGAEFRVFRSLDREHQCDTVEEIRIEMTRGVELSTEEIDAALSSLSKKGYVEEFESGRWRLSKNGYGVRRSLLGELESTD